TTGPGQPEIVASILGDAEYSHRRTAARIKDFEAMTVEINNFRSVRDPKMPIRSLRESLAVQYIGEESVAKNLARAGGHDNWSLGRRLNLSQLVKFSYRRNLPAGNLSGRLRLNGIDACSADHPDRYC